MDINSCYQLGYVIKPHGLNGDVSIFIDADNPQDYGKLESVFIQLDNQLIPFFITKIKLSGNKAIMSLEESNNIDSASQLKGAGLYLPLTSLPRLDKNQFYFHEIIGFTVQDKNFGEVGIIKSINDSTAQSLFEIDRNGIEILIPMNDEFILKVDRANKTILVETPEGLIDLYMS